MPMSLGMRPHGTPQYLQQRRLRAIAMIQAEHGTTDVARRLKVDPRSVRRWKADYRRRGASGLGARPASGRPPKLSHKERRTLGKLLLKGAKANGYRTELWTCPRIAKLIKRKFSVGYHVDHLPRLLRDLGFSCQKPARRAKERDAEAIKRWVAVDWPRIKKRRRISRPTSSSSTTRG